MKKIYKYILLAIASVALMPWAAHAQNPIAVPDALKMTKVYDETSSSLIIDAFVTGSSKVVPTPIDVVLVLDMSTSMKGSRLSNMKTAAANFIQKIYDKNPGASVYHKVAVIKFNNTTSTGYYGNSSLTDLTGSYCSTLKSTLNGLTDNSTATGTRAQDGLKLAASTLMAANDDRPKYVVFFTDGEPTETQKTFDCEYATQAVNYSYVLKASTNVQTGIDVDGDGQGDYGLGATVYSVATLDNEYSNANQRYSGNSKITHSDDNALDIRRFLNYVSSNFCFRVTEGTRDSDAYRYYDANYGSYNGMQEAGGNSFYQKAASDGSNLTAIFEKIAHGIANGGAGLDLGSYSSSAIDFVTSDFVLPSNAKSVITVQQVPCSGVSVSGGTVTYSWDYANATPLDKSNLSVNATTGKIEFKNFDFSKADVLNSNNDGFVTKGNWVGKRLLKDNVEADWYGVKLRLTIPIELGYNYSAGYSLNTNTAESGIHLNNATSDYYPFEIPVVNLPTIAVLKKGLANGDNAVFSVQRTKDLSGATVSDAPYYVILKGTGADNWSYAILKNLPEGTYMVSETTWSWTYSQQTAKTGVLSEENAGFLTDKTGLAIDDFPERKYVFFKFENSPLAVDVKHDEAVKSNVFNGGASSTPGSSSGEGSDSNPSNPF